jgi:D-tyrosyl-tRNA(Tyr) deacylase
VKEASVRVAGSDVARIERGLLVLVAFKAGDNEKSLRWMARKVSSLRVFEDDDGKMNLGLEAVQGKLLVVSQFTLYGDCNKGKRPSFVDSAPPDIAAALYDKFLIILREEASCDVESGTFQAKMHVALVNDGPVTLVIDKETD